jgi:hypothetical protein
MAGKILMPKRIFKNDICKFSKSKFLFNHYFSVDEKI